jgi:hypothetical protein
MNKRLLFGLMYRLIYLPNNVFCLAKSKNDKNAKNTEGVSTNLKHQEQRVFARRYDEAICHLS